MSELCQQIQEVPFINWHEDLESLPHLPALVVQIWHNVVLI